MVSRGDRKYLSGGPAVHILQWVPFRFKIGHYTCHNDFQPHVCLFYNR